jgi:hypothetical protein
MNRSEDDMHDPDLSGSEHGQANDEEEQNSEEDYGGEEYQHLSDPDDVRLHTLVA